MKRRIPLLLTLAGLAGPLTMPTPGGALTFALAAAQEPEQEFRWSGRIEQGRAVEVKGVNGSVRAERSSGTEVEVIAHRTARRSDPSSVTIEVLPHAGGVTVCALYPSPGGERANECTPGSGGRMSVRDNDVQVAFTVRVPDGVHFVARTVNGTVEATGLTADVEARTTNGSVVISTLGLARAHTTNGSIDVTLSGPANRDLHFMTTNGSITLTAPADLNATVDAATTNGRVESDFPITVQGALSPRRLRGVVGTGEDRQLVLQTTNGDIRLRRAGD